MIQEGHLTVWEAEKSALFPSALWAMISHTHTPLQENDSMGLACVLAGTVLVTSDAFASLSPSQKGGDGAVWSSQQLWRRAPHTWHPEPRFPSIYFCGTDCVCSELCCSGHTPEKEETCWAIFHHYLLNFLINEIQRVPTVSPVDHYLREKSQT